MKASVFLKQGRVMPMTARGLCRKTGPRSWLREHPKATTTGTAADLPAAMVEEQGAPVPGPAQAPAEEEPVRVAVTESARVVAVVLAQVVEAVGAAASGPAAVGQAAFEARSQAERYANPAAGCSQ
jgi:hypothetical protein